ncbi:hypothetical protein [Campylobacter sp.]|nr:hypothetical protein [Campylobacter sp.]
MKVNIGFKGAKASDSKLDIRDKPSFIPCQIPPKKALIGCQNL